SAARTAVEAWSRLVDPGSPELRSAWDALTPALRRAEALAAKARPLERTDPGAARNLYGQSLAVVADLPEALAGLRRTPPDPPTALDARVLGDRIRLLWTPPPPDGFGPLTFVILRKRDGALQHPGDGTRIAEVSTAEFDDIHVAPGETVGYAVLSKRGGAESIGAISLGPLVFLADVKDVRVDAREHEIELSWLPPRGVAEVRVVRKRGMPPANPRDGDRIAAAPDHALDRGLDQGQVYHYGIYAIYKMADGRLYPSPGVVVAAQPEPPVAPLDAPRLVQEPSGRVRIDWIEPARGSVRILRTAAPLPLPPGTRLTAGEAEALEGVWLESITPDRAYDPDPPLTGACSYTPLTGWGQTWTLGHGATLGRVADPSDLRATRAGGGLGSSLGGIRATLRWRWPAGASAAVVVARQGAPPQGPGDPMATTALLTRAEYDRHDCWTISLPSGPSRDTGVGPSRSEAGPWHLRVYSISERDDARSFSPGLEPTAATILPEPRPELAVTYLLSRPWLPIPGLPWSITLRTEPAGSVLPPLVVVAHPRAVPLSADDGQIIARFRAARDGARFPIRAPFNLSRYGVRIFTDPTIPPEELPPIRFRHPETGSTRV
ncbi:MAG TPA: hypothetical protein VFF52_23395, partial [Isosphaeraceae bacterium]|nr:hypothetical protein [Isosphaeraceae bacterium]